LSPRSERDGGGTAVVLFTRDLRVHDHAALAEVGRAYDFVVPLFVLDDVLLRSLQSPNRIRFLLESLADLRESLRALGADLVVRRGEPVDETIRLALATDAATVFVSGDASRYASAREERLARASARERLDLRVSDAAAVVPPGALTPSAGDHYRVFTPYWRRWRAVAAPQPTGPPRRLRLPNGLSPGSLPEPRQLTRGTPSSTLPGGGEAEGRRRVRRWLRDGLPTYEERKDSLADDATSRLSAYLHFGCVSSREVAYRAQAQGAEAFLRQLCWRDFVLQLLAANPETPRADMRPRDDRWIRDDEALERWRAGLTGYPIVDAAMRQLVQEGWMPNRARLVVASFLTKTLYLDWRLGARVFSELLVDGDLASNTGNWQWVAGTGADTRPNRVLNPLAQARRFDPEGEYVRRHVPELGPLDGAAVHEPWNAPRRLLSGPYPKRIVDHARAAGRFRDRRARDRTGAPDGVL
jgi:deoxyribodipyrimidine photo-lyase